MIRPLAHRSLHVLALCLGASSAAAQTPDAVADRYDLRAESKTYVCWFERSLLPGAGGSQVSTETVAPVFEYLNLRVRDLDAPWSEDSTDIELAAWGSALIVAPDDRRDADSDRRLEGDFTIANVRHRVGPAELRLGRQIVTAGSARFGHIDGLSARARAEFGLGIDAYAGLTVLPRWAERPGYYHLGSARDSLLRQPDALPEPTRSEYWMLGSRLYYAHDSLGSVGVSIHEQTEGAELGRRDIGADATVTPFEALSLSGDGFLDLDSSRLVEARAIAEVRPIPKLDVMAEYRRAEPALLLSRQSVLSVFSTDGFDEVGGEVGYRPTSRLTLGAGTWAQVFGGDDTGTRLSAKARVVPDRGRRIMLQLVAGRVSETENGYWSGRASLRYRFIDPAALTLEHYAYKYDTAIRGFGTSTVEAASIDWAVTRELGVLLGTSVSRTPYAALDAQTLLRVVYGIEVVGGEQ